MLSNVERAELMRRAHTSRQAPIDRVRMAVLARAGGHPLACFRDGELAAITAMDERDVAVILAELIKAEIVLPCSTLTVLHVPPEGYRRPEYVEQVETEEP